MSIKSNQIEWNSKVYDGVSYRDITVTAPNARYAIRKIKNLLRGPITIKYLDYEHLGERGGLSEIEISKLMSNEEELSDECPPKWSVEISGGKVDDPWNNQIFFHAKDFFMAVEHLKSMLNTENVMVESLTLVE